MVIYGKVGAQSAGQASHGIGAGAPQHMDPDERAGEAQVMGGVVDFHDGVNGADCAGKLIILEEVTIARSLF